MGGLTMQLYFRENNKLSASEVINVFKSVGWRKSEDDIISAFRNSWYITAYDGNTLIGFARVISDGHYYTNIFDVVVRPEYQKKGIAKKMVLRILEEFAGTYFFLTYTEGNRDFYEICGFRDNLHAMWIPKATQQPVSSSDINK
jgi:GNAT superfamily N-acetyltransferase